MKPAGKTWSLSTCNGNDNPENNELIGGMRKNNRAARAVRT